MICNFEMMFQALRDRPRRTLVVPAAEGESIVEACAEAHREGICEVILIGGAEKLRALQQKVGPGATALEVVDEPDPDRAVDLAIRMVRTGRANMLMKGKTDTPQLLKAVLDGEKGLRTGRVLSHVAVMEMPSYPRLMLWSDGGIHIRPELEKRLDIIRNAVEVAHRLGLARPNVALLSAMEKVNPKIEETVDYQKILELQAATPFVEAVLEGPMGVDVALSRESARIKGIESAIAGAADVFITPEMSCCNVAVKSLIYLAGAKVAGIVLGASVPIVLLSRSDDAGIKLRSIALGTILG